MTERFSVHHALIALTAGLIAIGAARPAVAEAGACHDLVGTYLTKNFAKGESGSFTSRSLISLSGSNQASFRRRSGSFRLETIRSLLERSGAGANSRSRVSASRRHKLSGSKARP